MVCRICFKKITSMEKLIMKKTMKISTLAATALLATTTSVSAGDVEVLHWWTSEAKLQV